LLSVPWFRFIEEARVTLPFRNGKVELAFANLGGEDGWAWVAECRGTRSKQIVLVRCGNVMALHGALIRDGFAVDAGSPAERIMLAAVKCGFAEELPEDERWRRELIHARAAQEKRTASGKRK
jgi:hypothetical protein